MGYTKNKVLVLIPFLRKVVPTPPAQYRTTVKAITSSLASIEALRAYEPSISSAPFPSSSLSPSPSSTSKSANIITPIEAVDKYIKLFEDQIKLEIKVSPIGSEIAGEGSLRLVTAGRHISAL